MATLIVPDIDENALEQLRVELAKVGSSVEAEVRAMIDQKRNVLDAERQQRMQNVIDSVNAYREGLREEYGEFPDTTEWIREAREAG